MARFLYRDIPPKQAKCLYKKDDRVRIHYNAPTIGVEFRTTGTVIHFMRDTKAHWSNHGWMVEVSLDPFPEQAELCRRWGRNDAWDDATVNLEDCELI